MSNQDRQKTWDHILEVEASSMGELCRLWFHVERKVERLQAALKNPVERTSALRLLFFLQDNELRKAVFGELVDLASCGHTDIELCRTVIKSIPLDWVRTNIMPAIAAALNKMADQPEVEEEAYRRYAELLREVDQTLLSRHVEAAVVHANEGVREVGRDFDLNGRLDENE